MPPSCGSNGNGHDSYFPDEIGGHSETRSNTQANTNNAPSVPGNSAVDDAGSDNAFGEEEALERERRKSVADSHVEKYVESQLKRIRTDESVYESAFEEGGMDEFEAQLD